MMMVEAIYYYSMLQIASQHTHKQKAKLETLTHTTQT